jgi:hypothetical protein
MKKGTLLLLLLVYFSAQAQTVLQPGFSGSEYREMLEIFSRQFDSVPTIPAPVNYHRVYRSAEVGLKNRWELWYRNDQKLGVISIRGTVASFASWLENFYAAMVPANGTLKLNDSTYFPYHLAKDSNAMVHVGWLVGMASLAPSIVRKVNDSYQKGIKEFIIFGHSQGGAIAYLLRSYLQSQQASGAIPDDIIWKTYCSAAPKPGNLFYAYDFDFTTRNGWAYNVSNTSDWVPQTPYSVQTVRDFSRVNPFVDVSTILGRLPLFPRMYLKSKFRKMDKATNKAQKRFEKYLGRMVAKEVRKSMPQLVEPDYAPGNNYQRAAIPIVLEPDAEYHKKFPEQPGNVFVHHMLEPYYYLSQIYYPPPSPLGAGGQ